MAAHTSVLIALFAASILPMTLAFLLPKNRAFYMLPGVRGFGLGVYAMLVILLLRESTEHAGFLWAFVWFACGLVASIALGVVFKEFHHHHSEEEKAHRHTKSSMSRILVSDFFHNVVDGIAIISGFSISPTTGVIALIGVVGHQMIQQAGQQVLLVESGIAPKKAFLLSFLVSLSLLLGYFLKDAETLEHIFIALSAGIVAWKVGTDILHTSWTARSVFGFFIGGLLLAIALLAISHGH